MSEHKHTYGNSSYYPDSCTTCNVSKKSAKGKALLSKIKEDTGERKAFKPNKGKHVDYYDPDTRKAV